MSLQNIFAQDFTEFAGKGKLNELEAAWQFYSQLHPVEQAAIRDYKSDNRKLDFSKYLQRVQELKGQGTADVGGKAMLIREINEHLAGLPEGERIRYLNGQPLKFKL